MRGSSPNTTPSALAARDDGPAAHRRPAVAELLGLHGLTLAAVRDGIETEVAADGVHVHEIVAAVRHDPAVPIEAAELAMPDLVDLAGGAPEVLAALRDGRRLVADQIEAVIDFADDVRGVAVAPVEHGIGHADERDERRLRRFPVAVGLAAEDRRRLAAVHEALEDAPLDVGHAPGRRALVVVLVVAVPGE